MAVKKKAPTSLISRSEQLKGFIKSKIDIEPVVGNYGPRPVVSTGSFVVDALIGGAPAPAGGGPICPGWPRKAISELFGSESSGKTTLCLASVAKVQREGGLVLYLDYEHILDHAYARSIGVKFDDSLLLYAPNTMEEGLRIIHMAIQIGVDLIVIDSLAAMVPQDELEKKADENAKVGAVAKKLAETLPKITVWLDSAVPENAQPPAVVIINQMRSLISTGPSYGGDDANVNTAGGKALKFYCAVRIKLQKIKSEYIERRDALTGRKKRFSFGNLVKVKIVKNKMNGTQGHDGNIFIRYGFGVDDTRTLIEAANANGIVTRTGPTYKYGGLSFKGQESFRKHLLENPEHLKEIMDKVTKSILDSVPSAISDDEIDDDDTFHFDEGVSGSSEEDGDGVDPSVEDVVVSDL